MLIILDFGGGMAASIARRIRSEHYYCEIFPCTATADEVLALQPKGLLLVGDAGDAWAEGAPVCAPELYDAGLPMLCLGYGARAAARHFGAVRLETVLANQPAHIGFSETQPFFGAGECDIFFAHCDTFLWPSCLETALSLGEPAAAFAHTAKPIFGTQYLPEAHNPDSLQILSRFASICGCESNWTTENFLRDSTQSLQARLAGKQAVIAISGGVDSGVCAVLMHQAIGTRMHCIHVDSGLLRKNETAQIADICESLGMNLHLVDASERVLAALRSVTDAQEKRKRIEAAVSAAFEEETRAIGPDCVLVRGTIYPDILENPHAAASTPLPAFAECVEPLRTLFKTEVRSLGMAMGLPEDLVHRQPFPGSGLANRIIGEVTAEKISVLRAAEAIFREEIYAAGQKKRVLQYFAVLMEGTQPDKYILSLCAVQAGDGDTTVPVRLPYDMTESCSQRILQTLPSVQHVLYDLTYRPLTEIEWQ